MATASRHYEDLLAERYTWMFGDFAAKVDADQATLSRLGVVPRGAARAVDLGCGSGFQSVALARLGFRVTAVDLSTALLAELAGRRGDLPIDLVEGDIRAVADLAAPGTDAIVCMGDTLTHLECREDVEAVLTGAFARLAPGAPLCLSFRDLTGELRDLDRFLPVRSDGDAILTCFLEYEPGTVKVHDLLHVREGSGWTLRKSFYRKLRLAPDWVVERLVAIGFDVEHREATRGLVTLLARRPA